MPSHGFKADQVLRAGEVEASFGAESAFAHGRNAQGEALTLYVTRRKNRKTRFWVEGQGHGDGDYEETGAHAGETLQSKLARLGCTVVAPEEVSRRYREGERCQR